MKFFEILWQRYFMKYIGSYSLEVIAFFWCWGVSLFLVLSLRNLLKTGKKRKMTIWKKLMILKETWGRPRRRKFKSTSSRFFSPRILFLLTSRCCLLFFLIAFFYSFRFPSLIRLSQINRKRRQTYLKGSMSWMAYQ